MSEPEWAASARAAGWLPPDEVRLNTWCARNLCGGDKCRWCGSKRVSPREPHKTYCRFYEGPVTHASAGTGHQGFFGYTTDCTCGVSFYVHDTLGNRQECPEKDKTWRLPRVPDLSVLLKPAS